MNKKNIVSDSLKRFQRHLMLEEKSNATLEKYLRDAGAFCTFLADRPISKELVMAYKQHLIKGGYAVCSVNSMLSSVNSFLSFLGCGDCRVKNLKTQRQTYCPEEKELTKAEYERLLNAAKPNSRLRLILGTICGTGIRVSELVYFTVEAVERGRVTVSCKNKTRMILLPGNLRRLLLRFAKNSGIESGCLFRTRNGKPIHRANIWHAMKSLCKKAGVASEKVFPHNLRKLFARSFYELEKDIAKLADVLGHSNVNTTRIYIMSSGAEHLRKIESLGLVL